MDNTLLDGLQRALADHCTPDSVRAIEAGVSPEPLWQVVDALGFADAFVAEEQGGIGLPLADACAIGQALGAVAFPLPLLETMLARALLAAAEVPAPEGRMVLADAVTTADGRLGTGHVPGLRTASHLLLRHAGQWHLLKVDPAQVQAGAYRPQISGALAALNSNAAIKRFAAPHTAAALLAPLQAALLAGSMNRVLTMSVTYANDRRQFGRPIGQFQAVQQELAVLAEQVVLARMAVQLGCIGATPASPDLARGASAKLNAADAAQRVTAAAHAVHGAIGITEEYPLGIHSRLLHELRTTAPTAGQCAREIGSALQAHGGEVLRFVREVMPAA